MKFPVGHVYPGAAEQAVVVVIFVKYCLGHYWIFRILDMMMSSSLYVIEYSSPSIATGACSAHLILPSSKDSESSHNVQFPIHLVL